LPGLAALGPLLPAERQSVVRLDYPDRQDPARRLEQPDFSARGVDRRRRRQRFAGLFHAQLRGAGDRRRRCRHRARRTVRGRGSARHVGGVQFHPENLATSGCRYCATSWSSRMRLRAKSHRDYHRVTETREEFVFSGLCLCNPSMLSGYPCLSASSPVSTFATDKSSRA
jgi:hypothetical protein